MHAPGCLAGVYKVARNTLALLMIARTSLNLKKDLLNTIRGYEIELQWLKSNIRKYAKRLSDDQRVRRRFLKRFSRNPLLGENAQEHGLWCMLWFDQPDSALGVNFRLIQSRALLAQIAVLGYWTGRNKWKPGSPPYTTVIGDLYRETLTIRHFAMSRYRVTHDEILGQLPLSGLPDTLITGMKALARQNAPQLQQRPSVVFRDICAILWLLNREAHPERVREINPTDFKTILGEDSAMPPAPPESEEQYALLRGPVDDEPERTLDDDDHDDHDATADEAEPNQKEVEIDT
jgi:hypothetical protein